MTDRIMTDRIAVPIWTNRLDMLLVREPVTAKYTHVFPDGSEFFLKLWFGQLHPETQKPAFSMSIQANKNAYCKPRVTVPWPSQYSEFEIFLGERELSELESMDSKFMPKLNSYHDFGGCYGYVPRQLVLEAVELLERSCMSKAYPVIFIDKLT